MAALLNTTTGGHGSESPSVLKFMEPEPTVESLAQKLRQIEANLQADSMDRDQEIAELRERVKKLEEAAR